MGDNPAKFEEAWKTWEHQVDVTEKLATSKLDDVKIRVVLREAPTELRDNLLLNSQQAQSKTNAKAKTKGKVKTKAKAKERSPTNKLKRAACTERKGTSRDCLFTSKPIQNSKRGGRCKVDSDAAKEFAFAIENIVSLSQSGCEVHEDGLVMIDSGASVNVRPKWFGESAL